MSGDPDTLGALLDNYPALARVRSPFGHYATLVHYVAANGVEASRQWQSPRNAVQVLRVLLRHGADPDAVCDAYGGGLTPLCALVSSAHPARAGVQGGLVEELVYSAGLGRRAVAELLLAEGPDLSVTEPVWRATAAGMARYHHRHALLALLEAS